MAERGSQHLRSKLSRKVGLVASCALLVVAVVGCGAEEGVADDATASVYVAASLCAEATREVVRQGNRAGDVRVRVVCLPSAERDGRLDLATVGANARRATQDTSAVGYIGEPTRAGTRFSEPILESARVAQLSESSGAAAMSQLLHAIGEAGTSGSLRESVNEELG